MLNYEMPPLFIEVGMLKKKRSKKRMGENPKKKEFWTNLRCFPTLRLYLDEFQSCFHDKSYSKVIIMTFKIIILNKIIPKG